MTGEKKTWSKYGWIRAEDCRYAEANGYQWVPLKAPKRDFMDREFTHILSRCSSLDHVLEPDTRVPNYSTSFQDALYLARDLKVDVEAERKAVLAKVDGLLLAGYDRAE